MCETSASDTETILAISGGTLIKNYKTHQSHFQNCDSPNGVGHLVDQAAEVPSIFDQKEYTCKSQMKMPGTEGNNHDSGSFSDAMSGFKPKVTAARLVFEGACGGSSNLQPSLLKSGSHHAHDECDPEGDSQQEHPTVAVSKSGMNNGAILGTLPGELATEEEDEPEMIHPPPNNLIWQELPQGNDCLGDNDDYKLQQEPPSAARNNFCTKEDQAIPGEYTRADEGISRMSNTHPGFSTGEAGPHFSETQPSLVGHRSAKSQGEQREIIPISETPSSGHAWD
ncbi:hypothetical protein DFH28DRAFT_926628 [Melampsora americana]|nr:hypothetical protein DFH28DRAFT_926628 [Melampsora americana]